MLYRTLLPFCVLGAIALADAPAPTGIVFRETTREAGLLEPLIGMMGHGGAAGDFDGDGKLDLYVGGFCDRPDVEYAPAAGPVASKLLRNLGDGKFAVVKMPAVEFHGRTSGAVFADLDNNGTLELYVANNSRVGSKLKQDIQRSAQQRQSQLFQNKAGQLLDISKESNACPPSMRSARNIGILDYDNDGLLDLLVVEDRFIAKPRTALFRNKGKLQFEDVTASAGLPDDLFGLGLAVADLNGDGRPDFFVPHSNRCFLSKGKDQYVEPAALRETFAWKPLNKEDWPCGAVFADLNRDGLLDLVVTIHGIPARNKLYLNQGLKDGIPQFRDISAAAGFATPVPVRCPHVEVQDFDNDGWPDIYVSAGWLDDKDNFTPLIFRNLGVKEGVPHFAPPRPIQAPMVYFPAGPSGDFDNDGRIDLFLINWFKGNHCRLLHNESAPRSWLAVQVVGTKQVNRMGIGSQVKVYRAGELGKAAALLGYQEVTTGYGYASGQRAYCHFGLGDVARVDVEVRLPTGQVLTQRDAPSGQLLTIREAEQGK